MFIGNLRQVHELRMEINSPKNDKKMDAVKKVIANMTVGKDVSMLFTDVVNCMQTGALLLLLELPLPSTHRSPPDR